MYVETKAIFKYLNSSSAYLIDKLESKSRLKMQNYLKIQTILFRQNTEMAAMSICGLGSFWIHS